MGCGWGTEHDPMATLLYQVPISHVLQAKTGGENTDQAALTHQPRSTFV